MVEKWRMHWIRAALAAVAGDIIRSALTSTTPFYRSAWRVSPMLASEFRRIVPTTSLES